MSNIKRIYILIAAAAVAVSLLGACGNNNSSDNGDNPGSSKGSGSPEEKKMTSEVFDSLNDMYSYINSGDYESYIKYWELSDEEKSQMLDNFKAMAEIADLKYELESVDVIMVGENRCDVTAITKNTSTSKSTGTPIVLRETMYYVMEKIDGAYHILTYSSGGNELIEETEAAG